MKIVLLGAPGAGKGTQAFLLKQRYKIRILSIAELLKKFIANNPDDPLVASIEGVIVSGNLVADEVVIKVLRDNIEGVGNNSFVLDGFPRTVNQAKALHNLMTSMFDNDRMCVINFDVSDEEVLKRLRSRVICKSCNKIFSTRDDAEIVVCDGCGSRDFIQREDDIDNVVRRRLAVYREETQPVIDYYKDYEYFSNVDGIRPTAAIFADIVKFIDNAIK